MPTEMNIVWLDHSNEKTRTKLYLEEVDPNGTNWPDLAVPVTGSAALIKAAMDAVTNLNHVTTKFSIPIADSVATPPADAMAQREIAIRWTYVDTVNGRYGSFHTYAPIDGLIQLGTDVIDLAANAFALAFVAVIEANAVSRDDNPIQMVSARLVGRNT